MESRTLWEVYTVCGASNLSPIPPPTTTMPRGFWVVRITWETWDRMIWTCFRIHNTGARGYFMQCREEVIIVFLQRRMQHKHAIVWLPLASTLIDWHFAREYHRCSKRFFYHTKIDICVQTNFIGDEILSCRHRTMTCLTIYRFVIADIMVTYTSPLLCYSHVLWWSR